MGKSAYTLHNVDMSTAILAVAVLLLAPSLEAQDPLTLAPSYSIASIANAATNLPAGFAPNSIISIYGTNLSYNTAGAPEGTVLPTTVGGVLVYFGLIKANLFYVSAGQIDVLIPYSLGPGNAVLQVIRDGTAGPAVSIPLTATAPGLFQSAPNTVLATHADSSLITPSAPASAGEVIIIYATGLGYTIPDQADGEIPAHPAQIANFASLSVLINGVSTGPGTIQYAGATPGCAGLYQINLQLPNPLPANPEVRVEIGAQISPAGLNLPTH
jgi:uncharacterized protein (TIGR03437 family)